MDKLKMSTPDLTDENIAKIAELFPNCITESDPQISQMDADGKTNNLCNQRNPRIAIDFDLLKQELSKHIVDGPKERYRLDWPGKRAALLSANTPIKKTLRPCREESVDFDNTENLFIEGDNLDALKLLQETYLGKVKMIYIDPPYNTGKDFIYSDKFAKSAKDELLNSGQIDEAGGRLVANMDSNGRFHSDWLSMMYPRLKLARNLLKDDGVIFISIDDNEQANLKRLCDEIFGEDNFIADFLWEKRTNRENRKVVSVKHDYILCYCKSINPNIRILRQLPMNAKALSNYKNPDNDYRGNWKSDPATAQAGHGTKSQFYDLEAPNGKIHKLESGRCWLYTKTVMQEYINDNKIWFGKTGEGVPRIKTYLHAKERGLTPESIIYAKDATTTEIAKNKLKSLFNGIAAFETPKPVELLKLLLQLTTRDELVLDFFAGSSATAHAVMQLNAEDGGNRKFIMVQLPEVCDEKSEAFKAGYKTIAEISKERIRRAGSKIAADYAEKRRLEKEKTDGDLFSEAVDKNNLRESVKSADKLDVGFRVLKVDSSNMSDVYYTPDAVEQDMLLAMTDNIKADRSAEDLLFQVLLDWGVDLTLPIIKENVGVKNLLPVYFVDDNALAACFAKDGEINEEFCKELAKREPLRVVFRDAGFANDAVKINVEQIFKQLSPHTEVKTI